MKIKHLSLAEFDTYANNHPLRSYHQTSSYGIMMAENGFDYDLIGFVNETNNILAAALILIKKIDLFNKYGYAPKGFLIDYHNQELVKAFTNALKKYYYPKNVAFIKINPEIAVGEININDKTIKYNDNASITTILENCNCRKLKNNKRFEALLPRFNAIIPLTQISFSKLAKQARNKIRKSISKGLYIEKAHQEDLNTLYPFIKDKDGHSQAYYNNYFNVYSKLNAIDIFLIKVDYEECLVKARDNYDKAVEENSKLVKKVMQDNSEENLTEKMQSDRLVLNYKNDILEATKGLTENRYRYIAGCITIKYQNRVAILVSGFDIKHKRFNPNYFMHYKLIEYYQKNFDYLDLNGITGDFDKSNPYLGLNEFKFCFKPLAYEYIGEFDFIINEGIYKGLESSGILFKEFNKNKKHRS